jgi:putative FmdB family regulatory protein
VPLYEYECDACGQRFEKIQKFSDPHADVCAKCGKGPVRRLLSSPAIQFKGSGWYITDYSQKGKSSESSSGSSKEDSKSGESKASETKADSTPAKTDSSSSSSGSSSSTSSSPKE